MKSVKLKIRVHSLIIRVNSWFIVASSETFVLFVVKIL